MTTVQYLNDFFDRRLVQKLFVRFSSAYGNLWTSRLGENGDWRGCEDDWLNELSVFTVKHAVSAIKSALVIYKNYPPTLGQLVDLCLKQSGVPDQNQVLKCIVDRDFTHPIVKLIHDKIGSWKLKNGTEKEVSEKVKEFYEPAIIYFKENPEIEWKRLQDFKDMQQKSLPAPEKKQEFKEHKTLKQRLSEYQQTMEDAKINCKAETYTEFDPQAINLKSNRFDRKVYEQYRDYLLSIPEEKTLSLPICYIYDRSRFINAIEQHSLLRDLGYSHNPQGIDKDRTRIPNGPSRIYKNWVGD